MLDIMYEVPARKDIHEVVITRDTIEKHEPPKLVFKEPQDRTGT